MTRLVLAPTSQFVGTLEPGWIDGTISTPSPFGSVSDGSDSTYTTLGSRGSTGDAALLQMRFNAPEGTAPAWMYMQIRARNTAYHVAHPGVNVSIRTLYMSDVDGDLDDRQQDYSLPFDNSYQLAPLAGGYVPTAANFNYYFLNNQANVDTSDPSDAGQWRDLSDPVGSEMFAALVSPAGLRVALWAQGTDVGDSAWHDYLDVFEVRLVLNFALVGQSRPRRLYPRPTHRVFPPPPFQQTGTRFGAGAIL